MKLPSCLLSPLVIFVALRPSVAQPANNGSTLAELHRALLTEVQGAALTVGGSPSLCQALGRAPSTAQRLPGGTEAAAGDLQSQQRELQRWYFGSNACVLQYPPALDVVVTKATTGLDIDLQRSPEKITALSDLLHQVTSMVRSQDTGATRELLLHTLAWEIGLPLHRQAKALQSAPLRRTACEAWDLLEATRPSPTATDRVASTLGSLAELAASRGIERSAHEIASGDVAWLEVVPVSDSHAEALLGRFLPRVFLSAPEKEVRDQIRSFLVDEGRSYSVMGRLPLLFDSLDAVLVLYFNRVMIDPVSGAPKVVPTDLVAFWQQYIFDSKVDVRKPDLPQAEESVSFRTVRFELDVDRAEPAYLEVEQTQMASKSFVEAMPPRVGSPVTVQRGVCLRCHTRVVETFHPEAEREVVFTRPLERPPEEVIGAYFRTTIEPELADWQAACRSASP